AGGAPRPPALPGGHARTRRPTPVAAPRTTPSCPRCPPPLRHERTSAASSAALPKPLLHAIQHFLPGSPGVAFPTVGLEPTVELLRLCRGQRHGARLGSQTLPRVLGELYPLLGREIAEVELRVRHAAKSAARAAGAARVPHRGSRRSA